MFPKLTPGAQGAQGSARGHGAIELRGMAAEKPGVQGWVAVGYHDEGCVDCPKSTRYNNGNCQQRLAELMGAQKKESS